VPTEYFLRLCAVVQTARPINKKNNSAFFITHLFNNDKDKVPQFNSYTHSTVFLYRAP
jgi:hypothetical protein